jgi:DNA-binding transcriptional ArsR family regulator
MPCRDLKRCMQLPLDMQPNGCLLWPAMGADVDKVFKALAAPERRLLLDRLRANNGQTLGQLCEHLDMTRQAVTKHLKLLEDATLVVAIWQGREKLHYLNPMPIHEIAERWIGKFERGRLAALADLKAKLEGESDG